VGDRDGSLLGAEDGTEVGTFVGLPARYVGAKDGENVGPLVGDAVGLGVGDWAV